RGPVSARSLNALATLEAVKGDQISVTASGAQAAEALQALRSLVEANFGEQPGAIAAVEARPVRAEGPPEGALSAVPVSDGIAIGPFFPYHPAAPSIPEEETGDPQA